MSFTPPTMGTTSYSPYWSSSVGIASAGNEASYQAVTRVARSSTEYHVARLLARSGFRGMRRAMKVLTGAAPGSAASETYVRVTAPTPFVDTTFGGVRAMETVTANSGNTTAAQETYIEDKILDMRYNANPSSYPVDTSGNGGGGKVGR